VTDTVQIALIVAIPPTLVALGGLVQAIRTHGLVNSRMTELLDLTRKSSKAEGVQEEKENAAISPTTRRSET
jgi:hypothetical protein